MKYEPNNQSQLNYLNAQRSNKKYLSWFTYSLMRLLQYCSPLGLTAPRPSTNPKFPETMRSIRKLIKAICSDEGHDNFCTWNEP